jgi:sigma54-dependent transcription regulator
LHSGKRKGFIYVFVSEIDVEMYRCVQKTSTIVAQIIFFMYLCSEILKGGLIMSAPSTMTQGVYLNIPRADWSLLQELISRFGWQSETREQMLDEFIKTRPQVSDLSEEDIMNEVRAVRYHS